MSGFTRIRECLRAGGTVAGAAMVVAAWFPLEQARLAVHLHSERHLGHRHDWAWRAATMGGPGGSVAFHAQEFDSGRPVFHFHAEEPEAAGGESPEHSDGESGDQPAIAGFEPLPRAA